MASGLRPHCLSARWQQLRRPRHSTDRRDTWAVVGPERTPVLLAKAHCYHDGWGEGGHCFSRVEDPEGEEGETFPSVIA